MQHTHDDGFHPVINPHQLISQADPKVFELFRAGSTLNVWRNTCPHNWWLERPAGAGDVCAYHWDSGARPVRAFFEFAKRVSVSDQKVSYGGWIHGAAEGKPVSEVWAFDDALYQASIQRWGLAVACADTFNRTRGQAACDVLSLSRYQRDVLRGLRRNRPHKLWPDIPLGDSVGYGRRDDADLCARGLAEVDPVGYLRGTDLLLRTVIPSEKTIQKMRSAL